MIGHHLDHSRIGVHYATVVDECGGFASLGLIRLRLNMRADQMKTVEGRRLQVGELRLYASHPAWAAHFEHRRLAAREIVVAETNTGKAPLRRTSRFTHLPDASTFGARDAIFASSRRVAGLRERGAMEM